MGFQKLAPIVFAVVGLVTAESFSRTLDAVPQKFEVALWNIHKEENPEFLADFTELDSSSDLFLVQEGTTKNKFTHYLDHLSLEKSWRLAPAFERDGIISGVLTGSKIKATQIITHISSAREPIVKTPKSSLLSYYPLPAPLQGSLLVVNTHSINFVGHKAYRSQLDELYRLMKDHRGPLIWAGDFNTWSRGRHRILRQVTQSLGLVKAPFEREPGLQLDHAFYRGLYLLETELQKHIRTSDHLPYRLTFELMSSQK